MREIAKNPGRSRRGGPCALPAESSSYSKEMFGGFALCTKSPNIFAGKYLCAPGGRKGRPYGKTIVFTTPVHFCNTPFNHRNSDFIYYPVRSSPGRAGRALSPCLALAEGRRFLSDQSRRKDLSDRPPLGECAGSRRPRAPEDRAGREGALRPGEGGLRGRPRESRPRRGRLTLRIEIRWREPGFRSRKPGTGGVAGRGEGRRGQDGYESCAPAPRNEPPV